MLDVDLMYNMCVLLNTSNAVANDDIDTMENYKNSKIMSNIEMLKKSSSKKKEKKKNQNLLLFNSFEGKGERERSGRGRGRTECEGVFFYLLNFNFR